MVRFDSYYSKNTNESKHRAVVDGFNKMAHEKGLKTWIKMVENEDVNNLSKELGIDYLQGKYLANLENI
jgi:EAL domain-containing protein (putative c-di-GMP-specific phosphodiesterase class I)